MKTISILIILLFSQSCEKDYSNSYDPPEFTDDGIQVGTLEEIGLDSQMLAKVMGWSLIHTPGEEFNYNSGGTIVLGEILRNASGSGFSGRQLCRQKSPSGNNGTVCFASHKRISQYFVRSLVLLLTEQNSNYEPGHS